jgi:hypothetical protein
MGSRNEMYKAKPISEAREASQPADPKEERPPNPETKRKQDQPRHRKEKQDQQTETKDHNRISHKLNTRLWRTVGSEPI